MVHSVLNDGVALKVAEFLLQIEAVKLKPHDPFTWASGIRSPIYCDNRLTLSHPQIRTFICETFAQQIDDHFGVPDLIAGVATGGIAHGALVAQQLNLPFIYVRADAKKHGMGNQIEGSFCAGQKVVVIEDLISTGKSSLNAVQALRSQQLNVVGLLAIFTYGFDEATRNFQQENCPFQTLTNYRILTEYARNSGKIDEKELSLLKKWNENPHAWGNP